MDISNGVPLLLVDRQMALVRNSDIHCTGSSIVYMVILDCLDNKTTQSQQRTRNVVWLCAITKGEVIALVLAKLDPQVDGCHLLIHLRSPRDYVGPPFFRSFVRSFALSPLDGASMREAHCEQASTAVRRTEAPCAQASTAVRFSERKALCPGYCCAFSDI